MKSENIEISIIKDATGVFLVVVLSTSVFESLTQMCPIFEILSSHLEFLFFHLIRCAFTSAGNLHIFPEFYIKENIVWKCNQKYLMAGASTPWELLIAVLAHSCLFTQGVLLKARNWHTDMMSHFFIIRHINHEMSSTFCQNRFLVQRKSISFYEHFVSFGLVHETARGFGRLTLRRSCSLVYSLAQLR